MIILTIRTDKPESEIGLYNDYERLQQESWQAHRQLAATIHHKLNQMLTGSEKNWSDIDGIIVYKGPGSFTGLRIGVSVANALAYGLGVPEVSAQAEGRGDDEEDWEQRGIERLLSGQNDLLVMPEYGAPVHITQQKK